MFSPYTKWQVDYFLHPEPKKPLYTGYFSVMPAPLCLSACSRARPWRDLQRWVELCGGAKETVWRRDVSLMQLLISNQPPAKKHVNLKSFNFCNRLSMPGENQQPAQECFRREPPRLQRCLQNRFFFFFSYFAPQLLPHHCALCCCTSRQLHPVKAIKKE